MCAIVGTSQPNISQHLNTLRHLGVVDIRKDGTFIYYSLNKQFLKQYAFLKAVLQYAKKDYQMSVKTCGAK
ncbi:MULTISPECIES: ArsR/SmtB family transcription factor [Pseudothermotoga]|uniref:ArsR/SmtB family transcription factor n=1 Tax=Pseudothermotoga TaxID=1643951 RepID=UPI002ADD3240|nr:ArsR family transcriptional regulator [Pseudothermotoga elfii]